MPDHEKRSSVAEPVDDVALLVNAERARLRKEAGLVPLQHFKKPQEKAFTAEERDHITVLFGGLSWKHEALIQAVFQGNGYKCEIVPCPDVAAFQLGKEYGNNGQCNPTYFTVGNLIQYLQKLEAGGMSRQDIINDYVFFTAGSCGPCRFGMYEAEYRSALQNAGFDGFRVLLFQQQEGINAASGEPGLKFTVDFGMGMLNALHLGDVMNDLLYQIRPFEVNQGESDRVFKACMERLSTTLRDRPPFEILEAAPSWARQYLSRPEKKKLKNTLNTLCKIRENLSGKVYLDALQECWEAISKIEMDRFRVKPLVKITGEFWAQTTEGDGNFHMFDFLEREGAQVLVEPISAWVAYLLNQAKAISARKKEVQEHHQRLEWWELHKHLARERKYAGKWLMLTIGEIMWERLYHRVIHRLGGITHHLADQRELAKLAEPFYNRFARGGEGHLEVGKNVYYTVHHLAHMVLAVKPFGCMPSSQSDGVQSAVINKFKDMIFLPIETSGEGEVNAHSRVQMALGDAKAKAKGEFETVVKSTGKRLDDLKGYVAVHPQLRQPFYHVPHREGVTGAAAQFVLHVNDLMNRRNRFWPVREAIPKASTA